MTFWTGVRWVPPAALKQPLSPFCWSVSLLAGSGPSPAGRLVQRLGHTRPRSRGAAVGSGVVGSVEKVVSKQRKIWGYFKIENLRLASERLAAAGKQ